MILQLRRYFDYAVFKFLCLCNFSFLVENKLREKVHLNPVYTLKLYRRLDIDSPFRKFLESALLLDVDNVKYDKFFLNYLETDIRSAFVFHNYILNYNRVLSAQTTLDKYFSHHGLVNVTKINESLPLYVDNLKARLVCERSIPNLKKVSVILTVYNEEALVINSLKSISNQTYVNFDIIIVDDASTDNTLSVITEFAKSCNVDIKIVSLKNNQGTYVCKNIGMLLSDGDILAFHDADDWSHPQKLERHMSLHDLSTDPVATISRHVRINEDGRFFSNKIYPLDRMCMISLIIDRKIFTELGFFRSRRFGSDSEYYSRIKNISNFDVFNLKYVLTFCAHKENSLTTGTDFGVREFGENNARIRFTNKWKTQHSLVQKSNSKLYVGFDHTKYNFDIICS